MGAARDLSGRRRARDWGFEWHRCGNVPGHCRRRVARWQCWLDESSGSISLVEELGDRATAVCCDVTDLGSLETSVNDVADLSVGWTASSRSPAA